jgi:ketose-bisphosphate aldolase
MPLVPIKQLMSHALEHQYAVGYFESWSVDSLQGVIDAAEASRSPVIIGFNGEFLSHDIRQVKERLSWYGALGRAAAESAAVPCGFIFNECPEDDWVRSAVTAGFNLVMPVPAPDETPVAYIERTRDIVQYAHQQEVAVEAELGELPFSGTVGGEQTDPQYAVEFVTATGIDLLAVSVGNIHVLLQGQQALDLSLIKALYEAVSVPMVLHGGTGIAGDSLREAIQYGIAKVNYGTVIKQRYLTAIREALQNPDENPHHLLGYGGDADIMVRGRKAVCEIVLEKMELLNCIGKADVS